MSDILSMIIQKEFKYSIFSFSQKLQNVVKDKSWHIL